MTAYLERIMEAVGRPETQPPPDWLPVHEYLGLRLPESFVEFTEAYGFALLGPLELSHPSPTARGDHDLLSRIEDGRWILEYRRAELPYGPERNVPYPIHPEPGGLIRWGTAIDGESFYFLARPALEPEKWPIVWHDNEIGERAWLELPGPFDRFMYDLVTGAVPDLIRGDGRRFDEYEPLSNGFDGGL